MLLSISFKNFRSIKEKQEFSMLAEKKIKEHSEHVREISKNKVLTVAAVYGRNASGKSNLIKVLQAIQDLVTESSDYKIDGEIRSYQPFRLDTDNKDLPVEFKIDFIANDNIRYLYEVIFDRTKIIKEVLWFYPKFQQAKLFERNYNCEITYGDYLTGRKKEIEHTLYHNQLFLSKVGSERIDQLVPPFLFFKTGLFISMDQIANYDELLLQVYSNRIANSKNKNLRDNINKLIRVADAGIQGLLVKEIDADKFQFPQEVPESQRAEIVDRYRNQVRTTHNLFKEDQVIGEAEFNIREESAGTIKLLIIGGLILEALADGQVLVIDELEKNLHPKLSKALVKLFLNKKNNPNGAQLIFATHDVSLLGDDFLRRDQIWLVEKGYEGTSSFYSVSDIQGIRKNVPLDKWYMDGRLGGVPVINEVELDFKF